MSETKSKMKLGDLPPELFQQIIQCYVNKVGLNKAWEAREVCTTFNVSITDEIFKNQPVDEYYEYDNTELFRKWVGKFLEYRVDSLRGAHDFIPSVIRDAITRIMEITKQSSSSTRNELAKEVIASLVSGWSNVHKWVIEPKKYMIQDCSSDTDEARLVCIVAGMGKLDLAEQVISNCSSAWVRTYCMGFPIEAAIKANNLSMVEWLIAKTTEPDEDKSLIIIRIIQENLDSLSPNVKLAERLVTLHYIYLGRPWDDKCSTLLCSTFTLIGEGRGGEALVEKILDMGTDAVLASMYRDDFIRHFHHWPCLKILELFLEYQVFRLDQVYFFNRHFSHGIHTREFESVLSWAVSINNPDAVRTVLQAGADPNGVVRYGRHEFPIRYAILNDTIEAEILELLLTHGAKMELPADKRALLDAASQRMDEDHKVSHPYYPRQLLRFPGTLTAFQNI